MAMVSGRSGIVGVKTQRTDLLLRDFNSLPRFGSGVVNPNLEHREAAFQLNGSFLRAFFRLKFSLDATVHFESVSGNFQGRIPPLNPRPPTMSESLISC